MSTKNKYFDLKKLRIKDKYIKILNSESYPYKNHDILKEYRKFICDYFDSYDFEWFCTLNLVNYVIEDCERDLRIWRMEMSKKDHIQVAHIGIIVTSKFSGPHAHLLMSGRNKRGETLLNKNKIDWQKEWTEITGRGALIENVYDSGAAEYMSKTKNTPVNDFELLNPYNRSLLEKYKKLKYE